MSCRWIPSLRSLYFLWEQEMTSPGRSTGAGWVSSLDSCCRVDGRRGFILSSSYFSTLLFSHGRWSSSVFVSRSENKWGVCVSNASGSFRETHIPGCLSALPEHFKPWPLFDLLEASGTSSTEDLVTVDILPVSFQNIPLVLNEIPQNSKMIQER